MLTAWMQFLGGDVERDHRLFPLLPARLAKPRPFHGREPATTRPTPGELARQNVCFDQAECAVSAYAAASSSATWSRSFVVIDQLQVNIGQRIYLTPVRATAAGSLRPKRCLIPPSSERRGRWAAPAPDRSLARLLITGHAHRVYQAFSCWEPRCFIRVCRETPASNATDYFTKPLPVSVSWSLSVLGFHHSSTQAFALRTVSTSGNVLCAQRHPAGRCPTDLRRAWRSLNTNGASEFAFHALSAIASRTCAVQVAGQSHMLVPLR